MSVATTTVKVDPFLEPYHLYRRLRDETPVYESEWYELHAGARFADVLTAHRDWHCLRGMNGGPA